MNDPVRSMIDVPGSEALWLLGGCGHGSLVFVQHETPVLRPAVHVLEYGQLVVRTPAQASALERRPVLTYHAQTVGAPGGQGWNVTATGPAGLITDPDEAAHYRRTLPGWTYGPHDTLVRIRPQTVSGFRLERTEAGR
ncbi:pyridoxamine 5'-phosphate oxidase family protein [Streptomyces sp. NBC_00525]|uniref:pyridoxamine 5'-phosphate oxidase family protein n=1 Tax=Streptomyces sp. NBC_00525 TaxID=2903660 RepID=UPI002E8206E0|nr:pyridoxamine 5'-phosphate oxidase family protein [Streptomyces sp. NBC_00525]WUC92214.1 pyridoxamine 5'-phosphate oxidase family protein [Streptomyces sp. NBC_00525]